MGETELSKSELDIDLESGGNTTEEEESKDQTLNDIEYAKEFFSKEKRSFVRLNIRGLDCITSDDASSSGQDTEGSVETFVDKSGVEMVNVLEKRVDNEKRRKKKSKNHSKPPLAPKGPSIGTADLMLVKEISELAISKRKRLERMNSLKRRKNKKASSCDINLWAMVFTVLFFFVIIFQGLLGSRVGSK